MAAGRKPISYFPGCSLATTAKENNQSLIDICARMGYDLVELDDWSCCGSSSAHSVDHDLALELPARNLFLAPADRPLLIACPSCHLRLQQAFEHLRTHAADRERLEAQWGTPFPMDLQIWHFFELLDGVGHKALTEKIRHSLSPLRIATYYGCMLAHPPGLRRPQSFHGLMERFLKTLGAEPVLWGHANRCCGTFLSVARPDIVTPMVDRIMDDAKGAGADAIVTACAMCHLNLEIRTSRPNPVPVFHFSEVLSLACGKGFQPSWLTRHLIDPRPVLNARNLL